MTCMHAVFILLTILLNLVLVVPSGSAGNVVHVILQGSQLRIVLGK